MADNIQSLIQQLAGTGSAGQAWLPSSINNGNPNTVYNQPPPEGGYLPPTSDALGNWSINKPQVTSLTDWSKMVTQDPTKVGQQLKPVWDPATSVPPQVQNPVQGQPSTGTPAPTPVTPAPAPKPIVVPGNMLLSNKGVPSRNDALYNSDPAYRRAWDEVVAHHQSQFGRGFNRDSDPVQLTKHLTELYTKYAGQSQAQTGSQTQQAAAGATRGNDTGAGKASGFLGVGSNPASQTGPVKGQGSWSFTGDVGGGPSLGGLSGLPDGLKQSLGVTPDGSISWQQIADFVLPGNVYLSQTGQWDASNFVAAMLGQLTGLPIDSLMTKLGEWQAGQDDPENFLEKILIDHYMDKANNQLAGKLGMSTADFKAKIAPMLSKAIADTVDMSSINMQNSAINELLAQAESKMEEKIAQKSAAKGGRTSGAQGGVSGGGARGGGAGRGGVVGGGGSYAPGSDMTGSGGRVIVNQPRFVQQ